MAEGDLEGAFRALREEVDGRHDAASDTLSRVLFETRRRAERRRRMVRRWVPLAAVLVGSSAWAAAGNPRIVGAVRSVVAPLAGLRPGGEPAAAGPPKLATKASSTLPAAPAEASAQADPPPAEPAPVAATPSAEPALVAAAPHPAEGAPPPEPVAPPAAASPREPGPALAAPPSRPVVDGASRGPAAAATGAAPAPPAPAEPTRVGGPAQASTLAAAPPVAALPPAVAGVPALTPAPRFALSSGPAPTPRGTGAAPPPALAPGRGAAPAAVGPITAGPPVAAGPGARPAGAASGAAPAALASEDPALRAETALFERAHRAHFSSGDAAAALAAWGEYLRLYPKGRFAPEAGYNRALALVRAGRRAEACAALTPYASGAGYRTREAAGLLKALGCEKAP